MAALTGSQSIRKVVPAIKRDQLRLGNRLVPFLLRPPVRRENPPVRKLGEYRITQIPAIGVAADYKFLTPRLAQVIADDADYAATPSI